MIDCEPDEINVEWHVEAKLSDGRWLAYYSPARTRVGAYDDYRSACRTHNGPVRLVKVITTREIHEQRSDDHQGDDRAR